jgi:hypothetical protein
MRDLLRNALRRNLQRARADGDTARVKQLEQRLNPSTAVTPVAVEEVPKRRGRTRKEVVTPPVVIPEPDAAAAFSDPWSDALARISDEVGESMDLPAETEE